MAGVGITNQRETAVVWDRTTGKPIHNALVWQDTRTDKLVDEYSRDGGQARFQEKVGLPLATYFSGPKIRWMLDNDDGAAAKADSGDLLFGNMDTWTIWNLTGGTDGGLHITDVTNASRTMLMDLRTLDWDAEVMDVMGVPAAMLPEIRASERGVRRGPRGRRPAGVQIAGDLGDQQAATFGQTCFAVGEAKNTYGTGNFLLLNTGTEAVASKNGLLTTVGYKIGATGRHRGHRVGQAGQVRPPQHPPDALRRGLLPRGPGSAPVHRAHISEFPKHANPTKD